ALTLTYPPNAAQDPTLTQKQTHLPSGRLSRGGGRNARMGRQLGATMRTKRMFLTAIVAVGIGLAGASLASAQSYPDRLIKIVVPYPPGGPADVAARLGGRDAPCTRPSRADRGQACAGKSHRGGGGRTGPMWGAPASGVASSLLRGGTNPTPSAFLYRPLACNPKKVSAGAGLMGSDP